MKLRILNRNDMLQAMTMADIIEADLDALKISSRGKADIPLRTNLDIKAYNGQSLYMPGYVEDSHASGLKIISVYPDNIEKNMISVPSTMILLDETNGFVKGVLDGTTLTQLRTGAVSGAATKLLAKEDAKTFLLIGTGGQAKTQLEAVLTVRNLEKVYVCDLNRQRAEEFAKDMTKAFGEEFNVTIEPISDADKVIGQCDIITTVTTSPSPVFDGNLIQPGTHINGVGSYTPDMQETPPQVLQKADKIYFDTFEGVMEESGDVIHPLQQGLITKEAFTGELGELALNKIKGRESEDEITWFKTVGSAVLDLVVGERIFQFAIEKNLGEEIEM